jgi:hypothetical protein
VSAADWLAVYAGAPTFIAAVTALVVALRSRVTANTTQKLLTAHIIKARDAGGPAARLKSGQ